MGARRWGRVGIGPCRCARGFRVGENLPVWRRTDRACGGLIARIVAPANPRWQELATSSGTVRSGAATAPPPAPARALGVDGEEVVHKSVARRQTRVVYTTSAGNLPEAPVNTHKNARLTPVGLLAIVRRALRGVPVAEVACGGCVSPPTVWKWLARLQAEGTAGLVDRASRRVGSRAGTPGISTGRFSGGGASAGHPCGSPATTRCLSPPWSPRSGARDSTASADSSPRGRSSATKRRARVNWCISTSRAGADRTRGAPPPWRPPHARRGREAATRRTDLPHSVRAVP